MSVILKCESLTVGYQHKAILKDVHFEIHSGEIVTVIGENGAGKSTLLKTIAGILPEISGKVYFEEAVFSQLSLRERAKKMSVLLTDKIHSEYMTCHDVICTGRYAYTNGLGMLSTEDKQAIEDAIEVMNLGNIKDRLFDKLSDGQKQRVMLARAICQNTKMIVLDEPTSFLDIGYKTEIMSTLKKLAKSGVAVLMTMHDLDLAKSVSDRVISLKNGRVDRIGSKEELFTEEYLCELFEVDRNRYREFYR